MVYKVYITATAEKGVLIPAKSMSEACVKAVERWNDGDYDLYDLDKRTVDALEGEVVTQFTYYEIIDALTTDNPEAAKTARAEVSRRIMQSPKNEYMNGYTNVDDRCYQYAYRHGLMFDEKGHIVSEVGAA